MASPTPVEDFLKQHNDWNAPTNKNVEFIESKIAVKLAPFDEKSVQIYYKHYKQAKSDPRGIVFLMHGIGLCSSVFAPLASTLSGALDQASNTCKLDVIAFDMIGHGRSDGIWQSKKVNDEELVAAAAEAEAEQAQKLHSKYSADAYVPDYRLLYSIAWRFIHHMLEVKYKSRFAKSGVPPVLLYGHGLGATTVLSMLLNPPVNSPVLKYVKGIVLENACVELGNAPSNVLLVGMLKGISSLIPSMPVNYAVSSEAGDPDAVANNFSRLAQERTWRKQFPEVFKHSLPLGTAREVLNMLGEVQEALKLRKLQLPVPTLILHGTADSTCLLSGAARLFDATKDNGSVQFKTLEQGKHSLLRDADALSVLETIKDFVQAQLK